MYNTLVFESPFETAYQGHLPNFHGSGALGVYNLQVPLADEVRKALIGARGLFVLTPVVLLAVAAAVLMIAQRHRYQRESAIALLGLSAMIAVATGIDGYGGASPGPRYLIPVLPLLAVPIAEAWSRWTVLTNIAAVIGAATMWLAHVTDPFLDNPTAVPVRTWATALIHGTVSPNIATGTGVALISIVATSAAVVCVAAAIRWDDSRHPISP
jgi:hypothetical protein